MVNDPKAALEAWTVAKKALDDSSAALRAAEAGHQVAERCEAEAWAAIVALRGPVPNTQDPSVSKEEAPIPPHPFSTSYTSSHAPFFSQCMTHAASTPWVTSGFNR